MTAEFPFKRNYTPHAVIKARFSRLKDVKPRFIIGAECNYKILNMTDCPNAWIKFFAPEIIYASGFAELAKNTWSRNRNVAVLMVDKNGTWEEYDDLSDYYQEHVRLACKRVTDVTSVLGMFAANSRNIREKFFEIWCDKQGKNSYVESVGAQPPLNYGTFDPTEGGVTNVFQRDFRDYIYANTFECNNFKPSLLVGLIKMLRAGGCKIDSMIDMSMGWGDRLFAALAADVKIYFGADPNISLHPGYNEIMRDFATFEQVQAYKFAPIGFEDAVIPAIEGGFDFAFSSPPFFNYEEYTPVVGKGISIADVVSALDAQSHIKYNDIRTWLDMFLIPSARKILESLRVGGLMIMSISDGRGDAEKFTANFIHSVNIFPDCEFLGCISYYNEYRIKNNKNYGKGLWNPKTGNVTSFVAGEEFPQPISPQPFWIWKKIKDIK